MFKKNRGKTKNKIAIIGSRGYPHVYSGYETFVKETFELLSEAYEIHVYCHSHLFDEQPKEVNGIFLHYIPTVKGKGFGQLFNSFISTLHAIFIEKYDVILYVNTANGPFGLLTKLFRVRTAIITDGLEWLRPKWKGIGSTYFYWASKLATKVFDVLISDSKEMQRVYRDEFDADSIVIAYGAHERFSDKTNKIKKFGLEKNSYYLIVGRMIPDNNADIIVNGFKKAETNKKLVIVGDVPYKDDYADKLKAQASDKIIFTGYVYDQELLMELYANAYVYIHGHEYGGTNPTLLKALAYGCSILALDTPFSREVLNDEEYGTYFKKEPKSIANAVQRLDSEPQRVFSQQKNSRKRIRNTYTWGQIADEYDRLFTNMINKNISC
ncbi:glycosyltransferase [Gracilimonas tropica]|uniref:glycosyltransferase n=1 Tax=Gracilimonas tropica TaxID=454600 RepID=UPI00037E4912|nr:glycosyltransferase [Gracilimonas tropica]